MRRLVYVPEADGFNLVIQSGLPALTRLAKASIGVHASYRRQSHEVSRWTLATNKKIYVERLGEPTLWTSKSPPAGPHGKLRNLYKEKVEKTFFQPVASR